MSRSVDLAKKLISNQFKIWSGNIGLTSFNSSKISSEFCKYQFHFVSPSYISSLTKISDNKKIIPAFVVADILIHKRVKSNDIDFFIKKINSLKSLKSTPKFLPFILVENVEVSALKKLKASGVIVGFIKDLFGDSYSELIKELINITTNAGAIIKKNPEAYFKLMKNLEKLSDGKTNNLKGDLFELAVAYHYGQIHNSIEVGKIIRHEVETKEIDVFSITSNKVVICECKGYNYPIEKSVIEEWVSSKIPIIKKWVNNQDSLSNRDIIFEFWSTGGFKDDAIQWLDAKIKKTKKYKIKYYDLKGMKDASMEHNTTKFRDLLKEYYKL